jgi:dipeptidyl aminopeptidase/acylaminoacyl peptidase
MAMIGKRIFYERLVLGLSAFCLTAGITSAQVDVPFQKPPKEILELADVVQPPRMITDLHHRYMAFLTRPTYKTLEELAEPELKLAGIRINPQNHNRARTMSYTTLSLQEFPSGKPIPIAGLPDRLRMEYVGFSPQGSYFSFVQVLEAGLELWTIELKTGQARRLSPPVLSAVLGYPYLWSPDEKTIFAMKRFHTEPYVEEKELPTGPAVQEAKGTKAAAWTYQDLLRNKQDEKRFDHFATRSIVLYALDGTEQPYLPPGVYMTPQISPDGAYILVEAIHPPYSYQFPYFRFPTRVAVFDRAGKKVVELVDKPLRDAIPLGNDAVETGPREHQWRDDAAATVVWCEAQDGGDPAKPAEIRDLVFQLPAPFDGKAERLCGTINRISFITWGDAGTAAVSDFWWKTRNTKTYLMDPSRDNPSPRVLFDLSAEDLYARPGNFVTAPNRFGRHTLLLSADKSKLYLQGEGYSPEGNRPFLDEYMLKTGKTRRLWRADGLKTYEGIVDVLDLKAKTLLVRIESPTDYPNYYIRRFDSKQPPRQITFFENPYKSLAGVSKRLINYKRGDGVDLRGILYLPAGYDAKRDGRLPMLLEAYPIEYKDKGAAGQVDDSPHRFVFLYWGSPVFWVARGYAVLENAAFPVVGQGMEEPNDTYVEQLVMDGKAAIDAVDRMGVVDPKRVGVMGHSYGAFMVANLLAHSDLFAAGLARSGAYNRSLTPFGFQAEERTYWQAQSIYLRMSPFNYADKINEPLLLIHGDADNNPGTFTLQSERLFQAVKGLGGTARLVLLPFESHGYAARENILHMLWEMDTWLEKYVKGASK